MNETLLLLGSGVLGGFLAGFLGIGGGIIYILIFPYILASWGYSKDELVELTIANSIFATLISAVAGNIALIINREFYLKEVLVMATASISFALIVLRYITYSDGYSYFIFNWSVIIILLYLLYATFRNKTLSAKIGLDSRNKAYLLFLIGAFSGIVAALSGLGGGAVTIPLLMLLIGMEIKKAKAISLSVILFTTCFVTLSNVSLNLTANEPLLLPRIVIPVSLAVILMTPIGVRAGKLASPQLIRHAFIAFLFLVIVNKIYEVIKDHGSFA